MGGGLPPMLLAPVRLSGRGFLLLRPAASRVSLLALVGGVFAVCRRMIGFVPDAGPAGPAASDLFFDFTLSMRTAHALAPGLSPPLSGSG